jgi:succinate dehydrogenase / fumarate reductase cytochrome b subunit
MERARPKSPNIQVYRPQLTSVLSIANRISGVVSSIAAVGLVGWLVVAATGPQPYAVVQGVLASWTGQIVLFATTSALFLHFCGGIRHLVWDAGYGFELRAIYASGWAVVTASVVLATATFFAAWIFER